VDGGGDGGGEVVRMDMGLVVDGVLLDVVAVCVYYY